MGLLLLLRRWRRPSGRLPLGCCCCANRVPQQAGGRIDAWWIPVCGVYDLRKLSEIVCVPTFARRTRASIWAGILMFMYACTAPRRGAERWARGVAASRAGTTKTAPTRTPIEVG